MVDIRERIIEVLRKGYLMSLGTVDSGGVWVADVIYIFDDDLNIYWMSKTFRRHSKTIDKINNKVAGTITITNNGEKNDLGLQFEGKAEKIEGIRFDLAIKFLKKRSLNIPKEITDILGEHSWYRLVPNKISLIDQENFERERQDLTL